MRPLERGEADSITTTLGASRKTGSQCYDAQQKRGGSDWIGAKPFG